ncbi:MULTISPECIES: DHH family phosphoesterase [Idiomarina]|uniref:DHH family phosphoesterase n=1 Tax=Idiomarina TaxID=135575 RepID=UPI00138A1F05|nr:MULTISPECIES: DHH family phosphoesterase [Idiomarina]MRJ42976.1 DHH family phosphoesterase [Idiomarina sp. FeN1]NCU58528.1 DHH family phosphoesterase [Idiomarina sp. FenA--70]NCU61225.1 DHH family phosphoesterase [Idiomarina sp. FenBw--71]UUN12725.1 DHH family phosphoesterase [Idiomarina loihiensis]
MKYIDVFNGDADGIFSLIQWRKAFPVVESQIISGVKRDNALIQHINLEQAAGAIVTALDLSFDKNTEALRSILPSVESVFYCDHHQAKTLFEHPRLTTVIDFSPAVCTGLLVSDYLNQQHHAWAIAAAFGDSLNSVAYAECSKLSFSGKRAEQLRELGVLVNYNGYGADLTDLHFEPQGLYQALSAYDSPFDIVADSTSPFAALRDGYAEDMQKARNAVVVAENRSVKALLLDDAAWARRISGTLGNDLAHANPDKAIVIATPNADGCTLTISLRAPKSNLQGAGDICSGFATGGGRAGAAGVNALPMEQLDLFINAVTLAYS